MLVQLISSLFCGSVVLKKKKNTNWNHFMKLHVIQVSSWSNRTYNLVANITLHYRIKLKPSFHRTIQKII